MYHGQSDLVELSLARNCESCEWLRLLIQFHLPEYGSEIQRREDLLVCLSDVSNAFGDFLHGIFVDMGILVQFNEILYDLESLTLFFRDTKDWQIVQ